MSDHLSYLSLRVDKPTHFSGPRSALHLAKDLGFFELFFSFFLGPKLHCTEGVGEGKVGEEAVAVPSDGDELYEELGE